MSARRICPNSQCQVHLSGKCVEGLEPANCGHFARATEETGLDTQEEDELEDYQDETEEQNSQLDITTNPFSLTVHEADELFRQQHSRLIVLAGEVDCGKTTAILELYERFLTGPFANFIFGGSKTLLGFERLCHPSRIASGAKRPKTPRTNRGEVEFLHLCVRRQNLTLPAINLVFPNISGEDFEAARDSDTACRALPLVNRADTCCCFFDGAKLADPDQRQRCRTDSTMLIRSLVKSNVLGPHSSVDIVFSKTDVIEGSGEKKYLKQLIEEIIVDCKESFVFRRLDFHSIASRPQLGSKMERCHGMESLFLKWTNLQDWRQMQ